VASITALSAVIDAIDGGKAILLGFAELEAMGVRKRALLRRVARVELTAMRVCTVAVQNWWWSSK
jgi:hypothetical protein